MKKKILFVAPNLKQGGAESVLVKIINNIDLNLFDVKLVLLVKEGEHLSKLKIDIPVINLKSKNAFSSVIKLKKVIKSEQPNIVFSIIGHVNIMLAFLKTIYFKSVKFIGRENVVYSEWLYKQRTLKKIVLSIAYKIFLKQLDFVIVQSNFMAKQIERYFKINSNKVVVLNNPIEKSKVENMIKDEDLGSKWNNNKINLVAVGRIERVKNYFEMVDILKELPDSYHLNILGDGNLRGELENHINKTGVKNRVTIHGFVNNPYKYMKNSFALLLTSTRESFPNVVLEANACGTYVVSYKMPGGISEIISNQKNGYLVKAGDKNDFVRVLRELSKTSYCSEKIKSYSEKYDVNNYMEKLYELMEVN